MKALYFQPNEKIRPVEVKDDLKEFQELVGGYIETVQLSNKTILICNEEGKMKGLTPNHFLLNHKGEVCDYIAGDFFIVGASNGFFEPLDKEDAKWCIKKFLKPIRFIKTNEE